MKVAAYQAPLLVTGDMSPIELIRLQVDQCAILGVEAVCCPEAILGGLADNSPDPSSIALTQEQFAERALPVAHPAVTLIVGFTEVGGDGRLYNSAAVIAGGRLVGVYRKRHPAIRRSVYSAGDALPVFTVGNCTFGIMICYDSTFPQLARDLVAQGASLLFIPTNTALPLARASVVDAARAGDIQLAIDNGVAVVRADVAGSTPQLRTPGATAITGRTGALLASAEAFTPGLVVAEIDVHGRG